MMLEPSSSQVPVTNSVVPIAQENAKPRSEIPEDQRALIAHAKNILKYLVDPSSGTTEDVINTENRIATTMDGLTAINTSVNSLLALNKLISEINRVGAPSESRSPEVGKELIHIAVLHADQRRLNPGNYQLTPGEVRLLNLYTKTHNGKVSAPAWYSIVKNALLLTERNDKLPGPEAYLKHCPEHAQAAKRLSRQLDDYNEKLLELRQKYGPSDDRTLEVATLKENLVKEIEDKLSASNGVDPCIVPECAETVKISCFPNSALIKAMVKSATSLSNTIEQLVGVKPSSEFNFAVYVTAKQRAGTQPGIFGKLEEFNVSSLLFNDNDLKNQVLGILVPCYTKIRDALVDVYTQLKLLPTSFQNERRDDCNALEEALSSIFVASRPDTRRMLVALSEIRSSEVQDELPGLYTGKFIKSERGSRELSPFLDLYENISLVNFIVNSVIQGPEQSAMTISKAVANSPLKHVSEFGLQIRELYNKRDHKRLIRVLDEEIDRLNLDKSQFWEKAIALNIILAISNDTAISRALKGRLRNIKRIEDIVTSMLKSLSSEENNAVAQYLEKLRSDINRRFLPDLSDYWGQKQLVKSFKELLDGHLNKLKNTYAWEGLAPSLVFFNGYLLYGPPGAGKSYLVRCMANELGLPLVTISREEMSAAFDKAKSGDEKQIESTLAEFLNSKIKLARDNMKKNGSPASVIFIDELEAEFLERDPQTAPRAEIVRTNIMLRVIESLIMNNPDIIFVGATNHIKLVDKAALRLGRYGVHLNVKLPDKEDALDIITLSLERLDINASLSNEDQDKLNSLLNECTGMCPLAIQLAINDLVVNKRYSGNQELSCNSSLIDDMTKAILKTKSYDYKISDRSL